MKRILGLALVALGLSLGSAHAQVAQNYWQCKAAANGQPAGWCAVSSANPMPVGSGGSAGAATAQAPRPAGATGLSSGISNNGTWATAGNTVQFTNSADTTYAPYLCGLDLMFTGATGAGSISAQIGGIVNQNANAQYFFAQPAGVGVYQPLQQIRFQPCLQGAAGASGLTITLSAQGAGATAGQYNAFGYGAK